MAELSLKEKKQFIIDTLRTLEHDDVLDIGKLLYRNQCGDKMKYSIDGCRIDLNRLPEPVITSIYSAVLHKSRTLKSIVD